MDTPYNSFKFPILEVINLKTKQFLKERDPKIEAWWRSQEKKFLRNPVNY